VRDLIASTRGRTADILYSVYMEFVPHYTVTVKKETEPYLDVGIPELVEWEDRLYNMERRGVMFSTSFAEKVFKDFGRIPGDAEVVTTRDGGSFAVVRFDEFVRVVALCLG
jgi:hypothetical protein